MFGKGLVFALSAVTFCAQTACVANNVSHSCTVEGAEILGSETTSEQICSDFQSRLEQALAAGGGDVDPGKFSIALRLEKRGTAEARLIANDRAGDAEYPAIAVDVMDRSLMQKDIEKLADEVARMLLAQ